MATEWIEDGVRINCVCPGTIYSETARKNYDFDPFEMARPNMPSKRCGTPDEIAAAVCFLNSPAAAYITGTTLTVDGGMGLYSPLMWQVGGKLKLHLFSEKIHIF